MLCGIPVVASDMPGVRLPVQRTGMGRLFEARNVEKLTACLSDVLENRKNFVKSRAEIIARLGSFIDPRFNTQFFDLV